MSQPDLPAHENGRRSPRPEIPDRLTRALAGRPSDRIEQHRERITAIVAEHHASDPCVFGSIVRGEDEPGSDVDLLVTFTDQATLLDEVGLRCALTDLLQVEVDVVAVDTLRGAFRDRVLRESVALTTHIGVTSEGHRRVKE